MAQPPVVVILAAGLGTRMKSRKPKVVHRAGGRALIEHVIAAVREITTPDRIFAVVGHGAGQVRKLAAPSGIEFIDQTEQKGTGHALMCGRDRLSALAGPLVVLYGDCPLIAPETLRRLIGLRTDSGAAAAVITTVVEDPTGYGRIVRDAGGRLAGIVEQKAAAPEELAIREINSGIYCFDSGPLWEHLGEITPDNPACEYYLTDIAAVFRGHGLAIELLEVKDPREVLGINNRVELAAIDRIVRDRIAERLMLSGVTIEKPETVTIDAEARVGMDTVIEPFAQILGNTTIGDDCRVGACSVIIDSRIGNGAVVAPFSIIRKSEVGEEASIGPFARLRFDNVVEAGAQVGNFVELKKTRLGAGSKAMHLAYLGDAEIGREVNIGAGTITCNYDGAAKHQTTIGDGAFVGSNNTLVAPVEIEADAYTAAGSAITKTVPSGALGLGRSRQTNLEGWVARRRGHTKP
jgi:bifunctional UDP-N-acetylglucosamine pyrophosphorylase / glucosamine-1-phosphate N-acetyltransferase